MTQDIFLKILGAISLACKHSRTIGPHLLVPVGGSELTLVVTWLQVAQPPHSKDMRNSIFLCIKQINIEGHPYIQMDLG